MNKLYVNPQDLPFANNIYQHFINDNILNYKHCLDELSNKWSAICEKTGCKINFNLLLDKLEKPFLNYDNYTKEKHERYSTYFIADLIIEVLTKIQYLNFIIKTVPLQKR